MKIYIGVTDNKWYQYLAERRPDEVNFWRPGGARGFQVLQPGEPFLFKLHDPLNYIAGGGFFVRHTALPVSLAWEAFQGKNGAATHEELIAMIRRHRREYHPDPSIGCSILTEPFFLPRDQWIPVPPDFARNIVQGKGYDTNELAGAALWTQVRSRLLMRDLQEALPDLPDAQAPRYGSEFLTRARLGQGAFRILVTDAYHRRCSATGERTLPVLEASHIKPFIKEGPNLVRNGLLLRSDLHTLYDRGYLTVTPDHRIEVSRRIRQEFQNGRDYYRLHGTELVNLPDEDRDRPSREYLEWHNANVFVA
jgi:putative restriction endonuclease